MNYIKKLEAEIAARGSELVGIKCGLTDLEAYLQSDKFREDPTVQVKDILNRVREAKALGMRLADETRESMKTGT